MDNACVFLQDSYIIFDFHDLLGVYKFYII